MSETSQPSRPVEAVFVGGVADGRRQILPVALPVYDVPRLVERWWDTPAGDGLAPGVRTERYYRVVVQPLPADLVVYLHESLAASAIMRILVAGYRLSAQEA